MTPKITGQVRYAGPTIAQIGLHYGMGFVDGIWPQWYQWIEQCPAIGELFIPTDRWSAVRRELNFDFARNMKGTTGKHVEFYRAVQSWLANKATKQSKTSTTGVKLKHHV